MMKNLLTLILLFSNSVFFAQEKPEIMKYPSDWRFEKIEFPFDFAKDMIWEGFEELRFSPNMFKPGTNGYFTYYFGAFIKNKKKLTEDDIQDFLNKYYRGLCRKVNSEGKFEIDYNKINARIIKESSCFFKANLEFYDSFTNGEKLEVLMHIEIKKLKNKNILMLVTATPKSNMNEIDKLHKANVENNLPK